MKRRQDQTVAVRRATPNDAAVIAWHRARMFQDMGQLPLPAFDALREAAERSLRSALTSGEYLGWLLATEAEPDRIVAGGGVQLRQVLPHPVDFGSGRVSVAAGRHGIVLNVYTEPNWRRRGLAELLMRHILDWAQGERLDRLVLHASDQGRRLYQRLGFVPTNEMRFREPLVPETR